MKTIYILTFLFTGIITLYAQENKTVETQDDIKAIKETKAFETKMMQKSIDKKTENKTPKLASEQGLEQKKQQSIPKSNNSSGKLLPNTASLEEILASIPNREILQKSNPRQIKAVKGLSNSATLEEIKQTIPKN